MGKSRIEQTHTTLQGKPKHFILVLLSFLYIASGYFGIYLINLPPGNLTLIWLPAGFGLLMYLYAGKNAFPFVLLCSFAVNSPFLIPAGNLNIPLSAVLAFVIASIDSLQSYIAWKAVKWIKERSTAPLLSTVSRLPKFFLGVCLIPPALTVWLLVLIPELALGNAIGHEILEKVFYVTIADILGLTLIGPMYWAVKQEKTAKPDGAVFRVALSALPAAVLVLSFFTYHALIMLVFPFLFITAKQGKLLDSVISTLLAALVLAFATSFGTGFFSMYETPRSFFMLMLFLLAMVFTSYGAALVYKEMLESQSKLRKLLQERTNSLAESEETQRAIISASPMAIFSISPEGNVLTWNAASENIFGWSKEEVLGRPLPIVPPEKHREYTGFRKAVLEGKTLIRKEIQRQQKDGKLIDISLSAAPVRNETGEITSIMSMAYNIGDKKIAEELLHRQLKEKEVLLKEVHHRIKNNLAQIGSFLRLQAGTVENEYAAGIIQEALNRVEGMTQIYTLLLVTDDYKQLSAKEYLEKLVQLLTNTKHSEQEISFETSIDDIVLDIKKLFPVGTIVNELITNSIKYAFSEKDSGRITISLQKEDEEIVLTVQDNGKGLPPDFDIDKNEGFGLLLVKMFTEQLAGTITMKNENGTVSIVRFPADED
ncbi:MAG: PAS domain S-box protein [Spirochaetia bacterium]